jgi:anaerobic selenocysteine-containing dehydrogenase
MEYAKLIAVTGLPGLYELISSRNDGAVIRSLDDHKTQFVANRVHSFSQLEVIEVYTQSDNVNLVEVFHAMEKASEALPDAKDNAAVVKYFKKVFPEMDFDRVYPSDQKKMVKWFEVLKKNNVEIKLGEVPEEDEEEEVKEAEPVAEQKKKGK